MSHPGPVTLRPYADADEALLHELLGDAVSMRYLGGAETPDAVARRHVRYLSLDPATHRVFTIESGGRPVGWIGYWRTDSATCEAGWHVLHDVQGHGIATAALVLLIDDARRGAIGCAQLEAFPSVENVASNALCDAAGFALLGTVDIEYPKGRMMRANHWRLELEPGRSGRPSHRASGAG